MERLIFLVPAILIIGVAATLFWWRNTSSPANPSGAKARDLLIIRGEAAEDIGRKLEKEGLIKSAFAFKLYTQVTGRAKEIQAGEYRLSPNLTLQELVLALTRGPQELWITYPEGFRREEIAARTLINLGIEGEDAQVFWQEFIQETEGEEGFLFPDTYLFPRDVSASTVAQKLRSTFDAKVTQDLKRDAQEAGLTQEEVVTLASLVERETRANEEKPVVAGILIKRWRAGWPLDVDATLQYVLASQNCPATAVQLNCKWWNIPTAAHRRTLRSPYNTYLNPGLPPGPIANPGIVSVRAVIYSEESPYWFYLHDPEGKIHYAGTIEEHEENINRYLR